ncbi:hypothetical protein QZM46_26550 [Burkholderia vietnamiensis]|jgi:hypothetical protein|uniref:Uncharacterized protein n=1 Tax=Burkholderia vietnamiensis TaxID=60552 RepID=A0AAW7TAC9_BURVI|nr:MULTISPECIES: hypothetical protein [Burkholderiaceae]MBH9647809.1 hypothetical protein [Burkholderia vietnamiensis]MBR7912050.1 hypothetical protein [Burkholderia vietnamiensis]MBR8001706.1 hypothetical protein [Burkholderia vietnamiensis]MBR8008803.1 hypothetical protein [Burkholderia vietnamiensis]MBR8016544.1 hypothetical protein [Burkholderia vietnamiensis]
MYLASIAGGHPGLSKFGLLAMGQQCVMGQTVWRVTEKISLTLVNEARATAMGDGFNRSMQQLDEISLSIKHRCA